MHPLRLTIPGRYWDSYIYKGRLYLFGIEGDIRTIDWTGLIESWHIAKPLRLPLECAFLRSDYLYGYELQKMVADPEVGDLIRDKFARLARQPLHVPEEHLLSHQIARQKNLCPFPHSDCEVYYDTFYVSGRSGVVKAGASSRTKYPISTRVQRIWDAPVHRISAAWSTLALAAGGEGLFEHALSPAISWREGQRFSDPLNITTQQCTDCNWAYYSIFGSAQGSGFLASYHIDDRQDEDLRSRSYKGLIMADELWGEPGYAWGVQDKLCLATKNGVRVLKYQPWEDLASNRIRPIGTIPTRPWDSQVISASSAPFGLVLELEDALVAVPSIGGSVTLKGEPVNWRVFPRARHYENQLHVVWDDHLEILSFNQDYLADQATKLIGVKPFGPSRDRSTARSRVR